MTLSASARLRTPEEIAVNAGADLPRLRLPDADVFAQRALRLRQLAAGHAMRDYLLLMAVVCEAQHARLAGYPAVPLPTVEQADAASQTGAPLLDTAQWPRAAAWKSELRALLAQVLDQLPADSPARAGVQALAQRDDTALEQQAERLLAGITLGLDMAAAPLIALPCCGSLPTASVTRVGGDSEGFRYLHCALCNAEWHMVRIKCTHCLSTGGVRFRALQALADADQSTRRESVQAETCDTCQHYLKIVHMDRDLHVEPVADDLASLTLDLLVAEEGYQRHGVNFMLLFGDGDEGGEAAPPPPERGSA